MFISNTFFLCLMTQGETDAPKQRNIGDMLSDLSQYNSLILISLRTIALRARRADFEKLKDLSKILERTTEIIERDSQDLETVAGQIGAIKALATQKGYGDILELLQQKFPYA